MIKIYTRICASIFFSIGLALAITSCGGGGSDGSLPSSSGGNEMDITPSSWFTCVDPRWSNTCLETQNSGFADNPIYQCRSGQSCGGSNPSCTRRNGTWYLGGRAASSLSVEEFRQGCLSYGGRPDESGTGDGTGTGGDICHSVETALQGWRGPNTHHARFNCAAACVSERDRIANCRILRGYPPYNGTSIDRLCTWCQN